MRAINLDSGLNMDQVARAVASEVNAYAEAEGSLKDCVLVIGVRRCVDSKIESGAEPQRKAQPR
jgi:hypothetical protein